MRESAMRAKNFLDPISPGKIFFIMTNIFINIVWLKSKLYNNFTSHV